jgi:HD-GYP domain-containing protein (c-di-GMP phosphodiesterase class II)
MRDVIGFLTSLAQALAKMSLYPAAHPARLRAADASFDALKVLQRENPNPVFSFVGDEVVYGDAPVRELFGWDWGHKLASAGIQRMEFQENVGRDEYRAFLSGILPCVSSGRRDQTPVPDPRTPVGGTEWIRYGAVAVRENEADTALPEAAVEEDDPSECVDLSAEASAIEWIHQEVVEGRGVALLEAETIVQSLAASMRAGQSMLLPLLQLKEFDQYTTTHSLNVSVLAMGLAEHVGLSAREVMQYGMAGLLHDLGKVRIPLEVLCKPGALSADERDVMRRHPMDGAQLILARDQRLDLCAAVAFEHHIMIDGTGYPVRMRRCDCHHASMLVHVCDVFDALRTNRPYRVAWEPQPIVDYIAGRVGSEFEPVATRAFIEMIQALEINPARADVIDEARRTTA